MRELEPFITAKMIEGVTHEYSMCISKIAVVQKQFIPYRRVRSRNADPRWMTNPIKHKIAIKKGIYKRMEKGRRQP